MELSGNTFLVTGGASGIGLALATRFLAAGSRVIVCGRREDRLSDVRATYPGIVTRVCDLARASERIAVRDWAVREFPDLNVLVNNAGIQRRMELASPEEWDAAHGEIAINLEAPIHLTTLFLPHLARQPRSAVLNVTSGLAFAPLAGVPVYCATKAAMHSFTLSLRHQLRGKPVEVVEVIPPAVDTDLGGPGLHTFGVAVDEFADEAVAAIARGESEVAYGFAKESSRASRAQLDAMFERMNARG